MLSCFQIRKISIFGSNYPVSFSSQRWRRSPLPDPFPVVDESPEGADNFLTLKYFVFLLSPAAVSLPGCHERGSINA
jgi:hypothetical protein